MPRRKSAPFVQKHMGGLRYYRRVPADVAEAIGRKIWLKRFDSSMPWAAIEHEARRLAATHDDQIRRARNGEVLDRDLVAKAEQNASDWLKKPPAKLYEFLAYIAEQGGVDDRAFLAAIEHGGKYRPPSNAPLLSAAYQRDVELYGKDRSEAQIKYAVETFIAAVGDKAITEIARSDAQTWLAKMEENGLAPGTIQRRLGALRAVIGRAYLDFDIESRNPFGRHKVQGGNGKADDCLPFNRAMLEKIDAHLATNRRVQHETKNIIRLMKGTGGGPGEIGGLVLSDVSLDGENPSIWIRPNAIRGLKTGAVRERKIPLIGEALEAAKDASKRASARAKNENPDEVPLFSGFDVGGREADPISAKVNKCIRSAGVPKSRRLVGYSYRHTLKEAMRSGAVPDHVQRRLLGHAGAGVADRYGSPSGRLSEARDALTAAIEHLGDVEESIYSAAERLKD